MVRGAIRAWGRAAALLSIALLSFAVVRSEVMRAAEFSPASVACGMPGMAMAPGPGPREAAGKAALHRACVFCTTAAHAPLLADAAAAPLPSAAFEPAPYLAHASLGPRGPPAFHPHARGPPLRFAPESLAARGA